MFFSIILNIGFMLYDKCEPNDEHHEITDKERAKAAAKQLMADIEM